MNIFVAKLSFGTEESDLREVFEEFGEVISAKIIMDKLTGKSKGYGFVEMRDEQDGQDAIEELNDTDLDGRTIVVKKAEPRERRDNNRGGGGYRGGRGGGNNYNSRY